MSRHIFALAFYGIGIGGILFSLVRTYYRVWQIKKETSGQTAGKNLKSN
jgi:hypothetical protein